MARIAGISFIKDSQGKARKVVFDLKQHAAFLQDYLDVKAAEASLKRGRFIPLEEFSAKMEKYYIRKK